MFNKIYNIFFWNLSDKKNSQYRVIVEKINEKERNFDGFNLDDVKNKTLEFRELFKDLNPENEDDYKKSIEILDSIKIDALALVKKACKLINGQTFEVVYEWWKTSNFEWNMIPYDVQFVWALAINDSNIAEMRTWEWKTLVAAIWAYLNAITWFWVHIVTVNNYLADRDGKEMWILYNALWLSVWIIKHWDSIEEKKKNYLCDIVYVTNNELWFDYLRDNMASSKDRQMNRWYFFAIIDEADSILIDEARTPLIISTPWNEPTSKYTSFLSVSSKLKENQDYKVDEKQKTAVLTQEWIKKLENLLWVDNIYLSNHYNDLHHVENALKAKACYLKDRDYILHEDEVMIVDEMTWRVMPWRRYSDGLHQALEAKEWVKIRQESKTLASITFQNYFRLYKKLSWMSWTAETQSEEFYKIYNLDVIVIPTNKPILREDKSDLLFKNETWKYEYLVWLIKELNESWRPILVWTVNVTKNEMLSSLLKKAWVKHNILNAKNHKGEAEIISQAWEKWAVTIATNMAWRWTDIKLWEWVKELWWLVVIWTEKHESRRIDNQLRWRSGRQWDPWMTQFLVSPTDEIMRIFWWDKLFAVFNLPMFASIPDNEPLTDSKSLTKKILSVQKQVEWYNFDARKNVLQYDDVLNNHREVVYSRRNKILSSDDIKSDLENMISSQIKELIKVNSDDEFFKIDLENIEKLLKDFIYIELSKEDKDLISSSSDIESLSDNCLSVAFSKLEDIKSQFDNEEDFYDKARKIALQSIDELWMEHINSMSKLKDEVAFVWYAQKDPLIVYKTEAYEKFISLIWEIGYKFTKAIFSVNKNSNIETQIINSQNITEDMMKKVANNNKKSSSNPLFTNQNNQNKTSNQKTKIRI